MTPTRRKLRLSARSPVIPYLVTATLAGVLAQRLVRRSCEHCGVAEELSPDVRNTFGAGEAEAFWCGKGCQECSGTGFRGRIAVY